MKKVITVILSVLLLATTLTVFASCGNDTPEVAIENYAKMLKLATKGNVEDVAPEAFWEELESEYDVTPADLAEKIGGGNIIDFSVTSVEEVDDLDDWKDANDRILGIDTDDITAVYIVEVESDSSSRVFGSRFTVFELDGEFYAVEVLTLLTMTAYSM